MGSTPTLLCGFLSATFQIKLVFRKVKNWSILKCLGNSTLTYFYDIATGL